MAVKFNLSSDKIAEIIEGECSLSGDKMISGVNSIDSANEEQIAFLSDKKYEHFLKSRNIGCIIVDRKFNTSEYKETNFIIVNNAHSSFAKLLIYLAENYIQLDWSIHKSAIIDHTSSIGESVNLGAGCIIGKDCNIESGVYIYPNVTIYDNVSIGAGTIIHSNTVICNDTKIGKDCLILPGAVIGSEGFGFIDNPDGSYTRIPQLGSVVIEDNVEIGSNTTIDRAVAGETVISSGVKLDNLIQIGHNVKVGQDTAMASQAGISGSVTLGKRNRIGGQVGMAGHLQTANDVIVLAQSGVAKTIEKSGVYFGSPIKDRLTAFKIQAVLGDLPQMAVQIHQIKKKLNI